MNVCVLKLKTKIQKILYQIHKEIENYFKSSLSKREILQKDIVLAKDFNVNLLDLESYVSFWDDASN